MLQRRLLWVVMFAVALGGGWVWFLRAPDVVPMTALVPAALVPAALVTAARVPAQPIAPATGEVGRAPSETTDPAALKPALDRLFAGDWKKGAIPDLWDGKTAPRIVEALEGLLGGRTPTA